MNKPVQYLLYAFAVATVLAMSATTIVLALLLIFLFWDLYRKSVKKTDFKKDFLLYALVYAWLGFTRALATSFKEIFKVKGIWDRLPYVVVGFYRINRKTVITIFHILFTANVLIILYALAQHFLGVPAIYKPLFYQESGRMSGYFGHPNQYAGCVSIIFLMNICIALYEDKKFFAYTPFLIIGVVFAAARAYFLGIFVCFIILLVLSKSLKKILTYAAVAAIIVTIIAVTVPWFSQRIMDGFSLEKNVYRLNFWKIAWDTFLQHPIVGVGSGMLPQHLVPYKEAGLIDNTAHAHNLYLHQLAETGVPGFILVVGIHFYFLVKYAKVFRISTDPLLKALSLGVSLAFVNLLVAGFFESNFIAAIVALHINYLMGVLEGYRTELSASA